MSTVMYTLGSVVISNKWHTLPIIVTISGMLSNVCARPSDEQTHSQPCRVHSVHSAYSIVTVWLYGCSSRNYEELENRVAIVNMSAGGR